MAQFGDREKNFEAKFAHDEAVRFKVFARRNKLTGLWAAQKLGLAGSAAEDYALDVVKAAAAAADEEAAYNKIKADLDAKGAGLSEHQIRREMQDQFDVARQQVMSEDK